MVQSRSALLANQLLRLALGAQVIARRVDRGLERGHMQQPSHAGGSRGLQHAAGQFDMGATKALPPKPRSLRMPTRLITTSLPRKRSLSCASS